MISHRVLPKSTIQSLETLDTCTVSNAIERLKVRPRNEGSVRGSALHCLFPALPPVAGYAVTGLMRSTTAPISGRAYHENMNWWRYLASMPEPRVMVVQDVDEQPGSGALVGELHASICLALHCTGYVTNGTVRDVPALRELGFQAFASGVSVSHMYAHVSDFGAPVEIGGLRISPGDLIQGDQHGVHIVPIEIAVEIPAMAERILEEERALRNFCQSPRFSLEGLDEKLSHLPGDGFETLVGNR